MFVQVIQAQVSNAAAVREAMQRWAQELSPGAEGWLGTTAGVTDDGRFVALARFDSAQAARRNSDRPEQGEWWDQLSSQFSGEATFQDSDQVTPDLVGDPDDATFVQVMQGRGTDPERAAELMQQDSSAWAAFRPDILGSLTVQHDGGRYTSAIYFTSEEDAREGERKEAPPELLEQMSEMEKLFEGIPEFHDLREPWLFSPS